MGLHKDIQKLKVELSRKANVAATPRQSHFDNVAKGLGYADSNIAFRHLGKSFIEVAKVGAPSIII